MHVALHNSNMSSIDVLHQSGRSRLYIIEQMRKCIVTRLKQAKPELFNQVSGLWGRVPTYYLSVACDVFFTAYILQATSEFNTLTFT